MRTTLVAFFLALVFCNNAQAMISCPGLNSANGCGTDGLDPPNHWFYSRGADVQMLPVSNYFCWLVHIEGNYLGTGPEGEPQGPFLQLENDAYWHLVTNSNDQVGFAMCSADYCFAGQNSDYVVEWDNRNYPSNFHNEAVTAATAGSGCDFESNLQGWPGIPGTASAVTVLQGWPGGNGAVNGNQEFGGTTLRAGGPNTLFAQTCVTNECSTEGCWGNVQATFSSIFVGSLFTDVPVTPAVTNSVSGNEIIDLGITGDKAICYLTRVQGEYRNSTTEVYLDTNPTGAGESSLEWFARAYQSSGQAVAADVACMNYRVAH